MKILEKSKKNWQTISYILAIITLIVIIYYYFSNIGYYNDKSLFYFFFYNIKNIIINYSIEIGFLLYFFKIITKNVKDVKEGNIYLVLGGLFAIITPLLYSIFSLINGTVLLSVHLTNLVNIILNFGMIQYFLSLKQNKHSKIIALISCGLISLFNIYYCFTSFNLINLFLVLFYLSLIPYFYTLELKDNEKIKFSLKEFKNKKALLICIGMYIIMNININSSNLTTLYFSVLLSLYILIFSCFNKNKLAVFMMGLEFLLNISYLISCGNACSFEDVGVSYNILLIVIIFILLKKPNPNKVNENKNKINEEIENDIEKEKDETENKNKKYKDLLDMGVISQEEYDNITKD